METGHLTFWMPFSKPMLFFFIVTVKLVAGKWDWDHGIQKTKNNIYKKRNPEYSQSIYFHRFILPSKCVVHNLLANLLQRIDNKQPELIESFRQASVHCYHRFYCQNKDDKAIFSQAVEPHSVNWKIDQRKLDSKYTVFRYVFVDQFY